MRSGSKNWSCDTRGFEKHIAMPGDAGAVPMQVSVQSLRLCAEFAPIRTIMALGRFAPLRACMHVGHGRWAGAAVGERAVLAGGSEGWLALAQ